MGTAAVVTLSMLQTILDSRHSALQGVGQHLSEAARQPGILSGFFQQTSFRATLYRVPAAACQAAAQACVRSDTGHFMVLAKYTFQPGSTIRAHTWCPGFLCDGLQSCTMPGQIMAGLEEPKSIAALPVIGLCKQGDD